VTSVGTSTRSIRRVNARSWFFPAMGCIALLAVVVGFGRTYAAPMARGTLDIPVAVHVHGAFAMAWVLLFIAQPLLVRWQGVGWHRLIGRAGLPIAVGTALTMIPAGLFQVNRDVAAGGGPTAVSAIPGVFTSGALFVALVAAGIMSRRNREAHARWLLLATLVLIWPAWFRWRHWFPSVPQPEIWFAFVLADAWIIVAMARDRIVRGAVHPVLKWGGLAVIAEQSLEVLLFDSPLWRTAAHVMYGWLVG
jgi:hypothetical protein